MIRLRKIAQYDVPDVLIMTQQGRPFLYRFGKVWAGEPGEQLDHYELAARHWHELMTGYEKEELGDPADWTGYGVERWFDQAAPVRGRFTLARAIFYDPQYQYDMRDSDLADCLMQLVAQGLARDAVVAFSGESKALRIPELLGLEQEASLKLSWDVTPELVVGAKVKSLIDHPSSTGRPVPRGTVGTVTSIANWSSTPYIIGVRFENYAPFLSYLYAPEELEVLPQSVESSLWEVTPEVVVVLVRGVGEYVFMPETHKYYNSWAQQPESRGHEWNFRYHDGQWEGSSPEHPDYWSVLLDELQQELNARMPKESSLKLSWEVQPDDVTFLSKRGEVWHVNFAAMTYWVDNGYIDAATPASCQRGNLGQWQYCFPLDECEINREWRNMDPADNERLEQVYQKWQGKTASLWEVVPDPPKHLQQWFDDGKPELPVGAVVPQGNDQQSGGPFEVVHTAPTIFRAHGDSGEISYWMWDKTARNWHSAGTMEYLLEHPGWYRHLVTNTSLWEVEPDPQDPDEPVVVEGGSPGSRWIINFNTLNATAELDREHEEPDRNVVSLASPEGTGRELWSYSLAGLEESHDIQEPTSSRIEQAYQEWKQRTGKLSSLRLAWEEAFANEVQVGTKLLANETWRFTVTHIMPANQLKSLGLKPGQRLASDVTHRGQANEDLMATDIEVVVFDRDSGHPAWMTLDGLNERLESGLWKILPATESSLKLAWEAPPELKVGAKVKSLVEEVPDDEILEVLAAEAAAPEDPGAVLAMAQEVA